MTHKTFRTSFNGYHRDDVNAYIAEQNGRFAESENDYKAQIAELRSSLEEVKAAESEAPALKESLSQAEALIDSQNQSLAQEKERNESLQAQLRSAEEKIALLMQEAESLRQEKKLPSVEASAESEDDDLSRRIGAVLIDAHANADEIVRRAQQQANEILQRASEDAAATRKAASDFAEITENEAQEKIRRTNEQICRIFRNTSADCLGAYTASLEQIRADLDSLLFDVKTASEKAVGKANAALSEASREMDRFLHESTDEAR